MEGDPQVGRSIQRDIEETAARVREWHRTKPYLITSSSVARVEQNRALAAEREVTQAAEEMPQASPDFEVETFRNRISG